LLEHLGPSRRRRRRCRLVADRLLTTPHSEDSSGKVSFLLPSFLLPSFLFRSLLQPPSPAQRRAHSTSTATAAAVNASAKATDKKLGALSAAASVLPLSDPLSVAMAAATASDMDSACAAGWKRSAEPSPRSNVT